MDRAYKKEAKKYRDDNNLSKDTELRQQLYPDFPLEKARLGHMWWLSLLFAIATGIYGFSVEWNIAIPLTLQFITAFTATAIFNINSTLMIDLYPSKPATATAINNLVRCTLGGIGVGFIERAISTVKEARVFLALAGLAALSNILVLIERKCGPRWRRERLARS